VGEKFDERYIGSTFFLNSVDSYTQLLIMKFVNGRFFCSRLGEDAYEKSLALLKETERRFFSRALGLFSRQMV